MVLGLYSLNLLKQIEGAGGSETIAGALQRAVSAHCKAAKKPAAPAKPKPAPGKRAPAKPASAKPGAKRAPAAKPPAKAKQKSKK